MLAIDWSHTRDFALFDGRDAKIVPLSELMDTAKKADVVVIESGAPLSVVYRLCRLVPTYTLNPNEVGREREARGLPKYKAGIEGDLIDAKIIFDLAGGDGFEVNDRLGKSLVRGPLKLDDDRLRLIYLYHQFLYSQRAWLKTQQIKKAMRRHFGDADNATLFLLSCHEDEYERRLESLRKEIERLAPNPPDSIARIKGMSKWLWAGIVITADPRLFPTKSAYRKYLGLMNRNSINHKFNRSARRAYWLIIDQFIKQNTPSWRKLYDDYKAQLATRDGYMHPHGGALNRVATKFADFVWDEVNKKGVIHQGFLCKGCLPEEKRVCPRCLECGDKTLG
jgi:hypothetical protein